MEKSISALPFTYHTAVVTRRQFDEHKKLYQGYVDKTNEITQKLAAEPEYASANATYSLYRGLKKGETYAIDGVIMHELYFQNLTGDPAPMGKKTHHLLERYWGSVDKWKADFIACANAARGWCVCVYEQRTDACRNILMDWHNEGQICTAYPLIVLDMYEHAYFLDYGTDKGAYIHRFLESVPWDVIEKRVAAVAR